MHEVVVDTESPSHSRIEAYTQHTTSSAESVPESPSDPRDMIPNLHYSLHIKAILNRLYPLIQSIQKTGIALSLFATNPGDAGVGTLMVLHDKLVQQRLHELESSKEGQSDLFNTFLRTQDSDGKPLDLDFIKSEILLVLTAGVDTTGTVMQGLIHHVVTMAKVKRKLMAEIAHTDGQDFLSNIPVYEELAHKRHAM